MADDLVSSEVIDEAYVPFARSEIESIEIDGEHLLFDSRRGAWHLLNPVAGLVWKCCDGSGSVEEICRDLSEAFDQDMVEVRGRVLETLRRLADKGLLEGIEGVVVRSGHGHDHGANVSDGPDKDDEPRFLGVPPSS